MAYNNSLTSKEKTYLTDALEMENLCIAKCGVYADQCQDSEIKNLISSISKNKRQHADQIKQIMGQSGNVGQYQ
jgi:hypothetical protein